MGRIVIVSNRLPVSVKKVDGKLEFYESIGGLATGLASVTASGSSLWIGWPGIATEDLSEEEKEEIRAGLLKQNCYPVFLSQALIEDYYNDYSNRILWPLFHSLEVKSKPTRKNWQAYLKANKLFADEALRQSKITDTIWVHDYQLLLVPERIYKARPEGKIGFFLHIPFPEPETWSTLPQASKLTLGILGADLVGFHTRSYSQNFLDYCREHQIGTTFEHKVVLAKHAIRVAEFPLGIDYTKFAQAAKIRFVQLEAARLRWKYRGKKVIVGFDRLDPTKGFPERLKAYRTLLKEHPELRGKIVFVLVGNPTRSDIPEYIELKARVERLVKDINKQFGTLLWQPVDYQYTTMNYQEIVALFSRADVGFIVPLRDGMNLVTKEYIAAQQSHPGVLVLSENAGAAEELKEAILVDPFKQRSIVDGLYQALTLPPRELKKRARIMQRHLAHFTADKWAEAFMEALKKPATFTPIRTHTLNQRLATTLQQDFTLAQKRLIALDYDGVLKVFTRKPYDAKPDKHTLKIIRKLASDERNDVIIISGRDKVDLSEWFGDLPVSLAAEHGALFRRKGGRNWHKTTNSDKEWRKKVNTLFRYFALETPGALIEQKECSLAWHYRNASPFYAQKSLVGLRRLLKPVIKEHNLMIKDGNKVLEVMPADISKANVIREWLIHDHDFVMTIGDDETDEDMFNATPVGGYSIKVGSGRTEASYRLKDVPSVLDLLGALAKSSGK